MRTCIVDTVNDTFETLCLGCCGLYPILSIPSLLEINVFYSFIFFADIFIDSVIIVLRKNYSYSFLIIMKKMLWSPKIITIVYFI